MKIYLVRHGQTDLNKERRLQGRKGLPLNNEGVRQAETLSERLKGVVFEVVYSSPQQRAVQTAQISSGRVPIIDERLDVFDLGSADTLKTDEVKTIAGGLIPDPKIYEGVEDVGHYLCRIKSFISDLLAKYGGKNVNVLICGHKCTTGCIRALFEGQPLQGNFLNISVSNGDCKIIDVGNRKVTI